MGTTILFTGDSITDGNRYKDEKDRGDLNHQMGHSYAYVINALLGSLYPEKDFHFMNRGISGNRIIDLYGRMYEDMVALKPDIVSILVGVNDGPQAEHAHHPTGAGQYAALYRMMLQELRMALPAVKLVLCEPFIGQTGPVYDSNCAVWKNGMRGYQAEVRKIAAEFGAVFVPLQECFDKVRKEQGERYWIWDGVHPTENGHGLIARQWLRCTGKMLGVEDFEKRLL